MISGGGEVDPRNFYIASFASDDTDLGVQLANWLTEQLPDGGDMHRPDVPGRLERQPHQRARLGDRGHATSRSSTRGRPTRPTWSTARTPTSPRKLQQYPDVDVVWINFSVASIGAAQAIGAMPEEDQPLLVTFYANPATVADINAGRVDAAVDESLEWQSWAGVDALMQLFARGQQPSQERAPTYNGVNFSVRQVIDADQRPRRRRAGRLAGRLRGVLPGQVVRRVHQPARAARPDPARARRGRGTRT